ncbi:vacuolar ATPase assembly integral membrane protein VMA21-like isoform X2 [Pecten maximus]|uniref:vacuolar ATPase assembly integral membrane protein VMA21-like isoform X2 n=1 Tax=Pecten maximus TaxID=6579 RepID=UPI0014588244|nr:vacuolar ATPase assembly integral membrane protein VMA21-like isoform X2 [Pecten maximus]
MADDLRSRMMGQTQEQNQSVMKTMILFSMAMLFLPVFTYFSAKSFFFEGFLGMTSQNSYFYSAFVAITVVHILLGLFVYKAFTEGTPTATLKTD